MQRLSTASISKPILNSFQRLKYYPPKKSQVSSKVRGKPRLSFTPIIVKEVRPWAFQLLLKVQRMLIKGQNDEAVTVYLNEMSSFKSQPAEERRDCYHRVISLFTKVGDFNSAISLCNIMQDEGYGISVQTCMVLFRHMETHDVQHIQQLRALLTSGMAPNAASPMKVDDFAFKTILDSMLLYRDPPKKIEKAFRIYATTRGSNWIPPRAMFGVVIQAYALAGRFRMAQYWLDKYRTTRLSEKTSDNESGNSGASPDFRRRLTLQEKIDLKLRLRYGRKPGSNAACFPYTAVLMGYSQSSEPLPDRLQWLFSRMSADGIDPDLDMCKVLIPMFIKWDWSDRAIALFESMLSDDSFPLPDAVIFSQLFISLNPRSPQVPRGTTPLQGITSRQLLKDMLALYRMRVVPPDKQRFIKLVSTRTFNCAIGTFVAQHDYAAAWTVLALFTRYHLTPDRQTLANVILGLLRRMRAEALDPKRHGVISWVDRFLGAPREISFAVRAQDRRLLGDHLYALGRFLFSEQLENNYQTYLAPTTAIRDTARHDMIFLVGLLRTALQAQLGYSRTTERQVEAAAAIKMKMRDALRDMFPLGRRSRTGREVFVPRWMEDKKFGGNSII